jgi:2-C-methyl-D-erythritol 4-phosphate cytidylyltransferase
MTIRAFEPVREIGQIIVVVPRQHLERVQQIVSRARFRKVVAIIGGGRDRQESVWNGLRSFTLLPKVVLVHDAVRPLVTRSLIRGVIRSARRYQAAVPTVSVNETLKVVTAAYCTQTLDRSSIRMIQTPQGFHFELLFRAHRLAMRRHVRATDDAALVERLGIRARMVKGSSRNIKITERGDLQIAGFLTKRD